jgi:predicted small lipoprotein YifL
MAGGAGMRPLLIVAALLGMAVLAACGKKGPPSPPGPPDQITWPRVYPTY